MKFAVFVFVAGLCLVAAAASVVPVENNDIEFLDSDDVLEIEAHGIFSGLYKVLKAALKSVKRVYCVIQAANKMKTAAQDFNTNVLACGGIISSQVQAVIDSSNKVIADVNNLNATNDDVCNITEDSEDSATSSKCFKALLKNLLQLKKDIKKTVKLIQNVPTSGADASDCVDNEVTKLQDTFDSFPGYMTECSKLTSS